MTDKPTPIKFGDEIDLHHFHPKDTKLVVTEFIKQAISDKLTVVKIIHGKGRSEKKKVVYNLLDKNISVKSYENDGSNWGATTVYLNLE